MTPERKHQIAVLAHRAMNEAIQHDLSDNSFSKLFKPFFDRYPVDLEDGVYPMYVYEGAIAAVDVALRDGSHEEIAAAYQKPFEDEVDRNTRAMVKAAAGAISFEKVEFLPGELKPWQRAGYEAFKRVVCEEAAREGA